MTSNAALVAFRAPLLDADDAAARAAAFRAYATDALPSSWAPTKGGLPMNRKKWNSAELVLNSGVYSKSKEAKAAMKKYSKSKEAKVAVKKEYACPASGEWVKGSAAPEYIQLLVKKRFGFNAVATYGNGSSRAKAPKYDIFCGGVRKTGVPKLETYFSDDAGWR